MTKIVSHEISKFGKLDIALHSKSMEFYDALDQHGLIDYLKNLDHLGFISKSHPGNNHKRWDYVMLQFFILHKLKDEVFRTGLGSKHLIDDTNKLSGIVILQIAILFSNLGHLKGTLASEIGFMKYLEENENKKRELLRPIPVEEWGEYLTRIFDTKDYYKSKYLIALNFVYKNVTCPQIKAVISKFFKNPMINDETNFRRLKWVFLKVRQISFVYLDSFNSDFPFQIDISKILLNPINYKPLFNPNSNDFESFFDSSERTLTLKLYISDTSAISLFYNKIRFHKHLAELSRKTGTKRLDYSNFLISFLQRNEKPFDIIECEGIEILQFYLSKEDLELFGIKRALFNYEEGQLSAHNNELLFQSLLNRGLTSKNHKVNIVQDQRKTLFFNSLLIKKAELIEEEQNQFLLNYFNLHNEYLKCFQYNNLIPQWQNIAPRYFYKHYARKIFLQLFKVLFKQEVLSAFIKFDNQEIISKIGIENPELQATGYYNKKTEFKKYIAKFLEHELVPDDVKNNFKILIEILRTKTSIKKNFNVFFCLFPIVLESYEKDPGKLYKMMNPESVKGVTDIDLTFVVFNKSQFELYLIEGKDQARGYRAAVRRDFVNKIGNNLRFSESLPEIEYIDTNGAKGGFVKFTNINAIA